MTDVAVQTDDILINGIPLSKYITHNDITHNADNADNVDNPENADNPENGSVISDDDSDTSDTSDIDESCIPPHLLFSDNEIEELRESLLYCVDENVRNNPLSFSDPLFHNKLENSIYDTVESMFTDNTICHNDLFVFTEEMENQIEELVNVCIKEYFDTIVPPRSYPDTCILHPPNVDEVCKKIEYLTSIPQEEQRTAGWYIFRNNLITASAAWKVFKTESCINQLVYEKCKPLAVNSNNSNGDNDDTIDDIEKVNTVTIAEKSYVNTSSPLHWGQKYEKLSVMLYEARNKTKIGEFGCIKHPKYDFLGASPDGINIDPVSPLYGRMLEIKNIVNRDITGTPIEEYWIQTQLQMQVCDCDECDFLETCFKEYEDEDAFLHDSSSDIDTEFHFTSSKTLKGVIAYFMKDGKPFYEYAPLYLTRTEYDKWCEEIIDKNASITWLKNIYWYLNQYSCVLIRKNDIWFESAIKKIENVWGIIIKERESGYDHRAPKKRTPRKKNIDNTILSTDNNNSSGCLIVISDLELNMC